MATLSEFPKKHWRIQYVDLEGKRQTVRLGKCSKSSANLVRHRIGLLIAARRLSVATDPDTLAWLNTVGEPLRSRLVRTGLTGLDTVVRRDRGLVVEFLRDYVSRRKNAVKPGTVIMWNTAIRDFSKTIPNSLTLSQLDATHARHWVDAMRASGLSGSTQHQRVTVLKQMLDHAVTGKRISSNPFAKIKISRTKSFANVEVSRQTIDRLLPHLTQTWRAIVVLARYGGLRCPSEVLSIRWDQIDMRNRMMMIPQPKNEGRGHKVRKCPLFVEVFAVLSKLKRESEYVVDIGDSLRSRAKRQGWRDSHLRTELRRTLKNVGIKPWPRLFHSMRASRQTELEREFGRTAACAWIGNSERVAEDHYLMVTSSDWERATGVESGSRVKKATQKATQPRQETARQAKTKRKKPRKT
jgi:integrase